MDIGSVKKAFEVAVSQTLKVLKEVDAARLREQLAGSDEQVLEAMKTAAEQASRRGVGR